MPRTKSMKTYFEVFGITRLRNQTHILHCFVYFIISAMATLTLIQFTCFIVSSVDLLSAGSAKSSNKTTVILLAQHQQACLPATSYKTEPTTYWPISAIVNQLLIFHWLRETTIYFAVEWFYNYGALSLVYTKCNLQLSWAARFFNLL